MDFKLITPSEFDLSKLTFEEPIKQYADKDKRKPYFRIPIKYNNSKLLIKLTDAFTFGFKNIMNFDNKDDKTVYGFTLDFPLISKINNEYTTTGKSIYETDFTLLGANEKENTFINLILSIIKHSTTFIAKFSDKINVQFLGNKEDILSKYSCPIRFSKNDDGINFLKSPSISSKLITKKNKDGITTYTKIYDKKDKNVNVNEFIDKPIPMNLSILIDSIFINSQFISLQIRLSEAIILDKKQSNNRRLLTL